MNDTYLMINGKKIELTAEQKKQLGIVEEKNCFDSVGNGEAYYCIYSNGKVGVAVDSQTLMDDNRYAIANYCTDRDIMHQRSLHETLSRLLWRYSMTHDGDKIDWELNASYNKIAIYYDYTDKTFKPLANAQCKGDSVYFHSKYIAEAAIEEIIKPFMEQHPEFVW